MAGRDVAREAVRVLLVIGHGVHATAQAHVAGICRTSSCRDKSGDLDVVGIGNALVDVLVHEDDGFLAATTWSRGR